MVFRDIRFPHMTVCPPEDTYTNLNYDLINIKNGTLDVKQRNELLTYTLKLLHEPFFNVILHNQSILLEEN